MRKRKTSLLLYLLIMLTSCQGPTSSKQVNDVDIINRIILTHEHVMSNYGKDINEASEYDEAVMYQQVIPYLRKLKSLGVETIFDCTTAYFGRRVDLLKIIADSTQIRIVTNTGLYGAANDRYVPQFAYRAPIDSLAGIWTAEFINGIDGTDIKPGFIKLAFDEGPPSEIDTKLFEAGLLTHQRTGLTLAVHTGGNLEAAELQLQLLREYQIAPNNWVWVHANKVQRDDVLIDAAKQGAWISLDGVNADNTTAYLRRLKVFQSNKLIDQVLLSHDGNGFPGGKAIRPFDAIMEVLIPAMLTNGFTKDEVEQIMVRNPGDAFSLAYKK